MSTATVPRPVSRWKLKYLLFAFIGLMFAYVLHHNESFLVRPGDPVWQHYHPFRWWLLPHGIAGACALILAPMQFWDRLRRRYKKLHRVAGRFYVAGAFIAAPLGIYIQFFKERMGEPRSFTMAAVTHGTLWFVTTAIAFGFILQGKVQQHRQWMTRSFAVGPLVFMSVRVIIGVTGWENLGLATVQTAVWMCLAFAIPLADMVLQLQELPRARPALAKAAAGAR